MELGKSLEDYETQAFCALLRKNFIENDKKIFVARHRKILVLASVYILGVATQTFKCAIDGGEPVFECSSQRSAPRSVATDKFYGASDGSSDTVLVVKKGMADVTQVQKDVPLFVCQRSPLPSYQKFVSLLRHKKSALLTGRMFCGEGTRKLYLCSVQWYENLKRDVPLSYYYDGISIA